MSPVSHLSAIRADVREAHPAAYERQHEAAHDMARTKRARTPRGLLRRWATWALAVTLFVLTLAAVLGSWRQVTLLGVVAEESTRTDGYQEAVYLVAVETAVLQGTLREPDGEERHALAADQSRTAGAFASLTAGDARQASYNALLVERQAALRPDVTRYLTFLDAGDATTAQEILETRIEPASQLLTADLRAEELRQIQRSAARLAGAQQDSNALLLGTLLTFVLGLSVLAAVGWAHRARRMLTERRAAQDRLTGLPNRAAFHARTRHALAAAGAGDGGATVLMLDLDGFKEVNDNLGHDAGDLLLIEVGRRLRGSVRDQDTVARLGGDEFAVLLTDTDPAAGELAASRLGEIFNAPFLVDGINLDIEVSIGIATAGPDDDPGTVLRHADIAMYTAKEHRLGHTRFNPGQAHDTASRLTMLGDLRRALDNDNELELYYQPKISVRSGDVIGAEALARWQHPVRGMIGPVEFIPVLEGTSLIHRFTVRVLDLALAQARRWSDAGHRIPVAVNVSTRSLLDETFPDTVEDALRRAGLPGELLCIEITENTVMTDPDRAIEVLRRIRALGVTTAIDDFGTGYSSMAYLKILPIDEIKVDRSFVRDMATDRSNHVLVESTVDLGHNLGLVVVAEGVEDDATAAALNKLGCDSMQGYHFARPLTVGDFDAYLTDRLVKH
jgi:diguanylate cyclase (GGDEF)-like protein